jgi:hypothetical protein
MAESHLRWQVPVLLSTQRTGHYDRVEWEFLHPCGDISSTVFTRHNELLSIPHYHSGAESSKQIRLAYA